MMLVDIMEDKNPTRIWLPRPGVATEIRTPEQYRRLRADSFGPRKGDESWARIDCRP